MAAASFVDGLGLLLVVGLACLLCVLLLFIWPCHIRMPDDRLGPIIPVRPGFPADVGDGRFADPVKLPFSRESGVNRFSALPIGLERALLFTIFLSFNGVLTIDFICFSFCVSPMSGLSMLSTDNDFPPYFPRLTVAVWAALWVDEDSCVVCGLGALNCPLVNKEVGGFKPFSLCVELFSM